MLAKASKGLEPGSRICRAKLLQFRLVTVLKGSNASATLGPCHGFCDAARSGLFQVGLFQFGLVRSSSAWMGVFVF
jgi:hypothetical protein